jgi:hypothetical protein
MSEEEDWRICQKENGVLFVSTGIWQNHSLIISLLLIQSESSQIR